MQYTCGHAGPPLQNNAQLRKPPQYELWWILPLLLLTFWLGARRLDADAIWLDEYFSLYDAGGGAYGPLNPAQIWERVATRNPWHAPGYFILLSGWGAVVGWEPAAARSLSLFVGVLAVAATYRLGRDWLSPSVGLYAAVVLGTSAFFVYYLHEVRMYTLIAFLTAFTLWLYLRILRSKTEPPVGMWLAFALCVAGTLYVHYLAAAPLAALGLYHLLFVRKDRRWWLVVAVFALAGVLFLPWARNLFTGVGLAQDADTLHDRALTTRQTLAQLGTLFSNGSLILLALTGAVALATLRRTWRVWFLAVMTLAVLLVANRLFQIIPVTRLRYLLSLWPLLALLVGIAVVQLRRWRPANIALLGAWAVLGLWNTGNPAFTADLASAEYVYPLNRIDDLMREQGQADDFVVNYLSDGMATVTYDRTSDFYFARRGMSVANVERKADPAAQTAHERSVLSALSDHERVWLTYLPDPRPALLDTFVSQLDASFERCSTPLDRPDLRVELWVRDSSNCPVEGSA